MKIALGKSCCFWNWEIHLKSIEDKVDLVDIQGVDLEQYFKEHKTEWLLPLSYGDSCYLENFKPYSQIKTKILFTSRYHINLFENKLSMIKFFIENGLRKYLPKTYVVSTNSNVTTYDENIIFPIVIKPMCGNSGSNVRICKDKNEFDKTIQFYGKSYAIQEYVKHDYECSGYFVCDKGKILASMTCEGVSGKGLYIKNKPVENPIYNTVNIEPFNEIFNVIGYSGFANVDFKIVNGRLYVFEINPRMGGDLVYNSNMMDLLDQLE